MFGRLDYAVNNAGVATHKPTAEFSEGHARLGIVQLVFIVNLFWGLRRGERTSDNPWEAKTLEWATTSPPPHDNFTVPPSVHRGPYDYSLPGAATDFVPQSQP